MDLDTTGEPCDPETFHYFNRNRAITILLEAKIKWRDRPFVYTFSNVLCSLACGRSKFTNVS